MRIGMILDKTFPPDPRVENEAVVLAEKGFDVFLFCLTYNTKEIGKENYKGFTIVRYLSNSLEYKSSAIAYDFGYYHRKMQTKIQDFILKYKISVWHIHDMRVAKAVYDINKQYNFPIVLDLHDNYPVIMQYYPHMQKPLGKLLISPKRWKKAEQYFIEKATKVISVSYALVDELKERVHQSKKENIVLVPNTVRESFYKKATIYSAITNRFQNDFVLLYLGDTHIRRGLLTAIKAIPNLKEHIPNIKLVIVGTNSTDPILKDKVTNLEIEKFVSFEGWQDVKKFPSYIQSAAIGLCPLHRNPQHDVAYANKLFQCMSFGIPLLVSNATAQKELVEKINAGWVHEEKNTVHFSDKVSEIYNAPEEAKQRGSNGRQFIENEFCWEKSSNNLVKIYQEIEEK